MSTEPPQTLNFFFIFWQQFFNKFLLSEFFTCSFVCVSFYCCFGFSNLTFPRKSLLLQLNFLIKKYRTFLKLILQIFNALVFIICNNLIWDQFILNFKSENWIIKINHLHVSFAEIKKIFLWWFYDLSRVIFFW